ncbi:acyl transferase domain-containing protein [Hirsutella rhossiliensis]|uniref:Acyl transferase domain-containing protein n=1 Tax=Hirsutella rhossiliensis TaxID=111463 RepID=A0A9P8N907_9HYPO|nr:acyl transferase domain-containing protein [Hirsutella rhossiliensis]KAH0966837.1 acyl transferase domain-containing protein [Hirsutella rhossiliensis]
MKTGVLSPSSTCRTFDAGANGYGRADGVNAVNGRTTGVTLPSVDFQEAVIRKAYAKAGIDFFGTDYVECHGTGTAVGDPIELDALGRCFVRREQRHPQLIRSVKANLGHSEAASGLTSLIKVVLAFQHGAIPPMLGPKTLNPKLRLEERQMKIATEVEEWPSKLLRRASLNSFGYGGANAHAILESFDSFMASNSPGKQGIVTSASSATLETRTQQISEQARLCDLSTIGRLAFTLALRVPQLTARTCLISRTHSHGAKTIEIDAAPGLVESQRSVLHLAFIFTGQGAQYPNTAKELLAASPAFLKAIREQDEVLKALPIHQAPNWTLEQAILDPPEVSRVHSPIRSQPLCTAIQIGLVQVMRSWGVVPSAVVGHSPGEIAAAYAAGLLSLSEAILVAYFRGVSVDHVHGKGAMMATGMTSEAAIQLIKEMGFAQEVHIACINAPENGTLSGSTTSLDRLCEEIQARGKFCRKLETGGRAYHSPMTEEVGAIYQDLLNKHLIYIT